MNDKENQRTTRPVQGESQDRKSAIGLTEQPCVYFRSWK
jgi:hypothetical protein